MKPRYQFVLSLTEEETKEVNQLRKEGVKIIEIFRKGIEVLKKK